MPEILEDEYLGYFWDDSDKLRLAWRSLNDGNVYNETPKQFWAGYTE